MVCTLLVVSRLGLSGSGCFEIQGVRTPKRAGVRFWDCLCGNGNDE